MGPTEPSSLDAAGASQPLVVHTFCRFDGDKACVRALGQRGLVDPRRSVQAAFAVAWDGKPKVLAAAVFTVPAETAEIHDDLITDLFQHEAPDMLASHPAISFKQVKLSLRGADEPTSADLLRLIVGQRTRIEALARK
jgi:hypothetical protein